MYKKLSIILISVLLWLTIIPESHAFTPSAKQIEQFKKLSPQQQKKIAKQLGYDLGDIQGNMSGQQQFQQVPDLVPQREVRPQQLNLEDVLADLPDETDKLEYFGYDLFAGEPTTFAPVTDIPLPSEYIVGPGDELVIQLFGKENESYNLSVFRDGKIQLPKIGPVAVSGLKFDQVRALLTKKIKSQILGVDVSISLGELRSMRVMVLGNAYKPGSYEVSSLSTMTNALFVSGGIKETGSLRNIQLKRRGKLISRLDLYDLLLKGDTSGDFRLQAGDVVFIPNVGDRVIAKGEVNRPAIYETLPGETINDLLKMAGRANAQANKSSALLNRVSDQNIREALNLNLAKTKDNQTKLRNGDELILGKISDYVDAAVTLEGAVTRAGAYHWTQGLTVSKVVQNLHRDLLQDADLNYSLIIRKINFKNDIKVVQFSLFDALAHKGNKELDVELKQQDKLIVFSIADSILYREHFEKSEFDWKKDNKFKKSREERNEKIKLKENFVPLVDEDPYDEEKADNSRLALLKSVLEQLQSQATIGSPLKIVTIQGEVNFPGTYPITNLNDVNSFIKASGGLKDSAYTISAELTRRQQFKNNPIAIKHIIVNLNKELSSNNHKKISFQSRDVLTIRIQPAWNEVKQVLVKGEVKFPGTYVISQGETLLDVLERAGGITDLAYTKGAIFLRKELQEREQALLKEMQERLKNELAAASLSEASDTKVKIKKDDSLDLVTKLDSTKALGRLVINLPKIIKDGFKSKSNLILKDGDEIAIPPSTQTISVMGQVQHPTAHVFDNKLNLDNYLKLSGGLTSRADSERVFVIKANGAVRMSTESNLWFASTKTGLEPGDTIVVPLNTDYTKPLTLWNEVTGIIFQTVVTLASLARL